VWSASDTLGEFHRCSVDHPFMRDLADCLHPSHGAVLVNLHRGEVPSIFMQLALKVQGRVWFDPFVTPVAEVYRSYPPPLLPPPKPPP